MTVPTDTPDTDTTTHVTRGPNGGPLGPIFVLVAILAVIGFCSTALFLSGGLHVGQQTEIQPQPGMALSQQTVNAAAQPGTITHDLTLEYQYNLERNPFVTHQPVEGSPYYPQRYADHQVHFGFRDGMVTQVTLEVCATHSLDQLPTDASTWDALRDWELSVSTETTVAFSHDVYKHENMYVDEDEPTRNGEPYQESPQAADFDNHGNVVIVVDAPDGSPWTFEQASAYMDQGFAEGLQLLPNWCNSQYALDG